MANIVTDQHCIIEYKRTKTPHDTAVTRQTEVKHLLC